MNNKKMIIICGPTATGKTDLGLKIAKEFNGEIVSADSRQVYKYMDIGTGKDIKNFKFQISNFKFNDEKIGYYLLNKIKVWGLDFVKPDYEFNVSDYKKCAELIINDIFNRNKIPVVVGGTGLYIKSLLEPMSYINIPPDEALREVLMYQSIKVLKNELEKIDKKRFDSMNNSDRNNPRRLIRAIEVSKYLINHYVMDDTLVYHTENNNNLLIGLNVSKDFLFKKIDLRIRQRIKNGLVNEIKTILDKGYGWNLPSMSALGYKEFKTYLENKISLDDARAKWEINEVNYSKRQMVWFKKMKNINWFDIQEPDFYTMVKKKVCAFLKEQ